MPWDEGFHKRGLRKCTITYYMDHFAHVKTGVCNCCLRDICHLFKQGNNLRITEYRICLA